MARYHELGHDAAQAVTEALILAEPEQTENDVAGLAAKALWAKGIQPLMTLVGGESRIARYRDPVPTAARIGERAMLSVCGRRQGLFASLTRFVYFRPPTEDEHRRLHDLAAIEAEAFQATEDLRPLPDIYRRLKAKYLALGYGEEIEKHHQGGATGYLPREELARPQGALGFRVEENTAFAWNPSFAGVKLEDTVVLGVDRRISILTHDSAWPTFECEGRPRPSFLVRA
jgi:Xaa-Pro aminopeptidase